MKIVFPQKITDAADVVSTNLVDTRYNEWNSASAYNRGDKVRISAQRSEYECLLGHDNRTRERHIFLVDVRSATDVVIERRRWLPGMSPEAPTVFSYDTSQIDSSFASNLRHLTRIAYDESRNLLWAVFRGFSSGVPSPHLYAYAFQMVEGSRKLVLVSGRSGRIKEISGIFAQAISIDIVGDRLFVYYTNSVTSRNANILVYDLSGAGVPVEVPGEGFTLLMPADGNAGYAGAGGHLAASNDMIWVIIQSTSADSNAQLRGYSRATKQEVPSFRRLASNDMNQNYINWRSSLTVVSDFLVLFGLFAPSRAYRIGATSLERSAVDDLDLMVDVLNGVYYPVDIANISEAALQNPATEDEAIRSAIIPDPDPRHWARIGATMPWRLFDELPNQPARRANSIQSRVVLKGPIDVLAFVNLQDCTSVNVAISRGGSSLHNKDYAISTGVVGSSLDHLTDDKSLRRLLIDDLPSGLQNNDQMAVTLTGGANLACGQIAPGLSIEVGETDISYQQTSIATFGSTRRNENVLGNPVLDLNIQNRVVRYDIRLALADVDKIIEVLELLKNGASAVWIGSEEDNVRGWVYGFYTRYSITYPTQTTAKIVIDFIDLA